MQQTVFNVQNAQRVMAEDLPQALARTVGGMGGIQPQLQAF